LSQLGFKVVAISADGLTGLQGSRKKHDLGYRLYSDASMTAARAFGIAFQLSDEMVKRYRGFGIDVEEASGRDHHQLPVPSVFLVEKGGRIHWVYSNPDYKVRPQNDELLAAARKVAAQR
jgi:peroxiredoxin